MNKAKLIIYAVLSGWMMTNSAYAAGLDEIYRDLVRSDNRGYLPLFVKNRQAPSLLDDERISMPEAPVVVEPVVDSMTLKEISLDNERQRREAEEKAAELRWQKVLKNVQNGYVSSFELEELSKREAQNNPQAVEVLAWIYSRGIGVKPDLIKAFNLYKKAVGLKVPSAMDNAVKVYRAMTPAQKNEISK